MVENLSKVLANYVFLSLKTQNYHWNVIGPNFASLHQMFEDQYNDLSSAIDDIAERIRALGEKTPATMVEYTKLNVLSEGNNEYNSTEMLNDLIKSHQQVTELLKNCISNAANNGDAVTEDMLIGRLQEHEKVIWFLKSSL
jgi:starvation-inducible DNA-binding protein